MGLEVVEFVFEDLVVVIFESVLLMQLLDLLRGFFCAELELLLHLKQLILHPIQLTLQRVLLPPHLF